MEEEEEEGEKRRWPPWLMPLLGTRFFVQCEFHAEFNKSECKMYCLDCTSGALCSVCLAYHRGHRIIQIRRSSYHDVIRVSEMRRMLDISGVQTYIINSARVVFLNERPQPKPGKGVTNTCHVCRRSLLDNFRFCSLGCKIAGTRRDYDFPKDVRRKEVMVEIGESDSEDSCTSTSTSHGRSSKFTPNTPPPIGALSFRSAAKRRKGIPRRAPLGGCCLFD